jgi:two-component system CheB/CheR fusion protein
MEKEPSATFVVGIGASADGAQAVEELFSTVPKDTGLVFVVVQYNVFDGKKEEGSLIKDCPLPVRLIEDGMVPQPDHVYCVPLKANATLENGCLCLTERQQSQRLSSPDCFFESLAKELGKRAVGIVLSGSGADGSEGVMALARAGGLTMAQTPETAKYDSMPVNAIETRAIDCVLDLKDMLPVILNYKRDPDLFAQQNRVDRISLTFLYDQIYAHLLSSYKVDFRSYKSTTVARRISRRVTSCQLESLQDYVSLISSNTSELDELYRDLLIGVTAFFRDQDAFQILQEKVLPHLIAKAESEGREFRVWIAACSTGEEAYSVAMIIKEVCEELKLFPEVKVFATDISKEFLARAGQGVYTEKQMGNVSDTRKSKFFVSRGVDYKIIPEIRNMVVFAPHNILTDPPFTKMDLVSCRNFLIYVQPVIQEKVTDLLRYATKIDGYLFLGPSETLGDLEKGMLVINSTWKIFQKLVEMRSTRSRSFPVVSSQGYRQEHLAGTAVNSVNCKTIGLQQYAYDQLLDRYIENGVLVDSHREIMHIFGDAARYLKYRSGQFDRSLMLNVYEELRSPLNSCFYQAELEKMTISYKNIILEEKGSGTLDIEVTPLVNIAGQVTNYVVVLSNSDAKKSEKKVKSVNIDKQSEHIIHDLEHELQQTRDSLQATIEKVETTNEELQSTNEELLASNEELRSTNEELHSVNKELYVVNSEHQSKIEELTTLNTDMDNLLRSTEIGTIFVDKQLNLYRFTPAVAEIFNFLPTDIGRPLKDFRHTLDCRDIIDKIKTVIETEAICSKEVRAESGVLYLMRIMPYLTHLGEGDGAILTFVDVTEITEAKKILEKEYESEKEAHEKSQLIFKEQKVLYRTVLNSVTDGWWDWNLETDDVYMSPSFKNLFGYQDSEIYNSLAGWKRLIFDADYIKAVDGLKAHLEEGKPFYLPARYHHKSGSTRWVICRGQAIKNKEGKSCRVVGTQTDITALKLAEKELDIIAHSDSLTGLPNRSAFINVLKRMVLTAKERQYQFCVLYIDLDDFKRINDSKGHSYGDQFLRAVTRCLQQACRKQDYLARVGGDEFVIISDFYNDPDVPDLIADRIVNQFSQPVQIGRRQIYSTLSIGLASYPAAGDDAEVLLKNADTAMYRAKKNGKNKHEYYTEELDSIIQRRLEIENRLRLALDKQELTVVYQPILDIKADAVVGFESLLRWHNKQLGDISPDEFIPIAEEAGLIGKLTDWLINQACFQFGRWQKRFNQLPLQFLNVNFSVLLLARPEVAGKVIAACETNQVSPAHFVLEMTETALLDNMKRVEKFIRRLRDRGFGVAIDDFGTGYSSLTALKELPITHLKIDQSFIQGVGNNGDQAIIQTLLRLGEWMNIRVIAEGIETKEQLAYLQEHGCTYAQGFCLAKPMTGQEIDGYLESLIAEEVM